ncbi:MAG: hypothetical protein Q7R77_01385 [Candidatus Daviesbacteria bacterium]|nr:hypothetical protein [Candidatus Daviesbacteria bacterium]
MRKLPVFLKQYFWDVDFNKLERTSKTFILKRILDRGDDKALKWLLKHYTKDDIQKLLLTTRDLSAKTANFWADLLNIDKRKVVCLQKPYSRIQFGLSS